VSTPKQVDLQIQCRAQGLRDRGPVFRVRRLRRDFFRQRQRASQRGECLIVAARCMLDTCQLDSSLELVRDGLEGAQRYERRLDVPPCGAQIAGSPVQLRALCLRQGLHERIAVGRDRDERVQQTHRGRDVALRRIVRGKTQENSGAGGGRRCESKRF
jgi:hypothetical protein